jgi:hypothetical protein
MVLTRHKVDHAKPHLGWHSPYHTMKHKGETIRAINACLQDPSTQVMDETIAAVQGLGTVEVSCRLHFTSHRTMMPSKCTKLDAISAHLWKYPRFCDSSESHPRDGTPSWWIGSFRLWWHAAFFNSVLSLL